MNLLKNKRMVIRSPNRITLDKHPVWNYLVAACLLIFFSCSSGNSSKLFIGVWTIDKIDYQGKDISKEISLNAISFERNEVVLLPGIIGKSMSKKERQGTWRIDEKGFLFISSKNHFFDGRATYCFKSDDTEDMLKVIIESDDLYLEATKFFSKYDSFGPLPCVDNEAK